ncbi:hypothetical protein K466DRAFT_664967 [Polyporus arcularius HHB13444]|uniref:Uncharacterized protein n=1 Tax=Polyporus arcularius HHB13444 TaxID=1314778 RepID=A0A5C3P536_9APHY|nr:hypothetical protein K466DRAFT_664967 [Polyporus arcularius HHB13444]
MLTSLLHALSVAALAVSAAAVTPSRTTRDAYPDVNPVGVVTRSLAMNPLAAPLTNAQRLSRGLGPNRPRRAYGARRAQALQPRQSSTPCVIQATGKIAVYGGSALSGYLWRSANAFGEYGLTLDESQALIVNICEASGVHNIYAQNGFADFPFLGLISGAVNTNDNMSPSSFNYAYVGGTIQTLTGSPAISGDNSFTHATRNERKIESAVWSLGSDNALTLSWVNSNGARVNCVIVHVVSGTDDSFVATAGYSDYVDMFGPSALYSFRFVPL